ncbi:unnamed protein product [Lupinus luteus]|uniref:glucan endo-1,3-beta-D-glucosidase n=1 Tax=Lupinus luteus TaxID=3873 RepID=A0AAV1Y0E4_LUPLU
MAQSHLIGKSSLMTSIVLQFVLLIASIGTTTGAQTGVCYGTLGNNLPPPKDVVNLFNQQKIQRVRIYDPNHQVLEALRGSNIELVLGIPNTDIENIAASPVNAKKWVQDNVKTYANVKFRYIVVGNEVKPGDPFAKFVVPAMQNIQTAISEAGLSKQIKVSTAIESGALGASYPPSNGAFRSDYLGAYLDGVIKFLVNNDSPLLANVYPYFSYVSNPNNISLDYALFKSTFVVVRDNSLHYTNLFDASVDAIYFALEKAGGSSVRIVISETGWPSSGGASTTLDNAKTYNINLVQRVKAGTPKRPAIPLETYLFAMFDENQKTPEYEKFWGLFLPNKQPKYPIVLN